MCGAVDRAPEVLAMPLWLCIFLLGSHVSGLVVTDGYGSQPNGIIILTENWVPLKHHSIVIIAVAAIADEWSGGCCFRCSCRSDAL